LQTRYEDIREAGGEVVAVSVDSPEDARAVVESQGLEYPVLSDPDLVATDAFGLRHEDGGLEGDIARPAVFVIDRDGRIAWRDVTDNWRVRVRPEVVLRELERLP
jgi:peroxiredoxin